MVHGFINDINEVICLIWAKMIGNTYTYSSEWDLSMYNTIDNNPCEMLLDRLIAVSHEIWIWIRISIFFDIFDLLSVYVFKTMIWFPAHHFEVSMAVLRFRIMWIAGKQKKISMKAAQGSRKQNFSMNGFIFGILW